MAYFEPDFPESDIIYGILWALGSHCLVIKKYEKAIYYGKRSLNIAKGWSNLFSISHASKKLIDIYLKIGRFDQASLQQLDVLDWNLAIGQVWQTLGFFWGIIPDHPQIFGDGKAAVSFLSMVYHHPETIPTYQQGVEKARPRFEEELGSDDFAVAWERGKELDLDSAVAQMRVILAEGLR